MYVIFPLSFTIFGSWSLEFSLISRYFFVSLSSVSFMIYNLTKSIESMLFEASIFYIFLILMDKKMQISLQTVSFISFSLFMQIYNPSRPWSSMNSSRFPSCGSCSPDLSFFQKLIYSSNYRIFSWRIVSLEFFVPFLLKVWNC